jgi:hypothetical protein
MFKQWIEKEMITWMECGCQAEGGKNKMMAWHREMLEVGCNPVDERQLVTFQAPVND